MAAVTQDLVATIARRVIEQLRLRSDPTRIVVGVSNRHVHLSEEDLRILFGQDAMTVFRPVRQPGEFAAEEMVAVHGPRSSFPKVRLMGPPRKLSQVELSRTDCVTLGIDAPICDSGQLDLAAPVEIEGPRGRIKLAHAAMVAGRHIHMGPSHVAELGINDGDRVSVQFEGQRGGVLDNFLIRVKPEWVPEIHLDTDEANGIGVRTGDFGRVILK